MKKNKLLSSFSSLLGLVALSFMVEGCKKQEAAEAPLATVEITNPQRKDIPVYKTWAGTLNGMVNATIRAQVTGYLLEQSYKNGQKVKKGQELFKIDKRTFEAALNQAEATLAQAEASYTKNKMDVERYTPLVATNAVSHKQLDDAVQAMKESEAAMAAAKASIESAKLNLGFTTIISPIDGIAGIANAQTGDLVGQSGPILTEVSQVDPIKVEFAMTEQDWLVSGIGAPRKDFSETSGEKGLQIILSTGDVYEHTAKPVSINREVDTNTASLRIEAELPNPSSLLRPGMFVNVKALISTAKDALVVPTQAIITQRGSSYIITINEKDEPVIVPINPGAIYGKDQVITPLNPEQPVTLDTKVVVVGTLRAMSVAMQVGPDGNKEKLKTIPYVPQEPKALMSIKKNGKGRGQAQEAQPGKDEAGK